MRHGRPRDPASRTVSAGSRLADGGDDVAVRVLQHGVAALQRRQRRQGPHPGAVVVRGRWRRGRGRGRPCGGRARAGPRPRGPAAQQAAAGVGQRRAGRGARRACAARGRPGGRAAARSRVRAAGRRRASSSADVGHHQLGRVGGGGGADVGDQVEQRLCPARGRSRRRRACASATTARTSPSSEKGSRSSTEPPPRAMTMTSTSGSRVEPAERLHHLGGAAGALHRGVARTPKRDRRASAAGAFSSTSRSAAEPGAVTRPTGAGQERQRRLRSAAKRPSAASSWRRRSMPGQQLAEADHADLAATATRVPRLA